MKVIGYILGAMLVMVFILCVLTPEKDKYGEYTQVFKYWTDNVYFEQNFKN